MASTDLVKVQRVIVQTENAVETTTIGVEEKITVGTMLAGSLATAAVPGAVYRGVTVPAAAVPFADLTAAANAYNALRTSLINAGIIAPA